MKEIYTIQPYKVGTNRSSLALVIPSEIVKKYRITSSTVFVLRGDNLNNKVILETINDISSKYQNIPASSSFLGSEQQVCQIH